jgi:hypothetical protein
MVSVTNYVDIRKILRQKGTIVVTELVSEGPWVRLDKADYVKSIQGKKVPLDYNGDIDDSTLRYDPESKVLYHFHGAH